MKTKDELRKEIEQLKEELKQENQHHKWTKHFKGYNEKELKVISKFIFMNPQGIDGVIKMSKKKDFKPFIQKAAKNF